MFDLLLVHNKSIFSSLNYWFTRYCDVKWQVANRWIFQESYFQSAISARMDLMAKYFTILYYLDTWICQRAESPQGGSVINRVIISSFITIKFHNCFLSNCCKVCFGDSLNLSGLLNYKTYLQKRRTRLFYYLSLSYWQMCNYCVANGLLNDRIWPFRPVPITYSHSILSVATEYF